MLTPRPQPPGARRPAAGMTLIEVMVAMVVLAIIGAVVISAIIHAGRMVETGQAQAQTLQQLQHTLQRVSREVRAADPLVIYENEPHWKLGATVYRDHTGDGQPDRLEFVYRVDSTEANPQLVQDQYLVDEDGDRHLIQRGVFIDRLAEAQADQPLFRYFDANGQEIVGADAEAYATAASVEITANRTYDGNVLHASTRVGVRSTRFDRGF